MSSPNRPRAGDRRRAQLLAVGQRLFARRAPADVSIEEIAAAAGVSRGLLYHYFPSKADLYAAVVARAAAGLVQALAPDPARSGVENTTAALHALFAFVGAHREAWLSLVVGLEGDARVLAAIEEARAALAGLVLRGAGLDPAAPIPRAAARAWIAAVEAAATDWVRARDHNPAPLVDLLCASLFVHLLGAARAVGAAAPLAEGLPLLSGLVAPRPPELRVVAAAIVAGGRVLAARRAPHRAEGGLWELPGGKVEPGESDRAALIREIAEELSLGVEPERWLADSVVDRPQGRLRLVAWVCRLAPGAPECPVSTDHDALAWVGPAALGTLDWAPADLPLLGPLAAALAEDAPAGG
jgi:AcrR family transcriptional regulator